MFPFCFGGRAGGEEGANGVFRRKTGEREAGFEGVGGDGRDVLPAGDGLLRLAESGAVFSVRGVVGELVLENPEGDPVEIGFGSAHTIEEGVAECLTV